MEIPEKVSSNKAYSGFKHWSVRNKLKDLYHSYMLRYSKIKIDPSYFPLKITYEFEWIKSPLDSTNQFFMIKMIEDGLVVTGVLPDDSNKYVRETSSRSVNGKRDMIRIKIEKTD